MNAPQHEFQKYLGDFLSNFLENYKMDKKASMYRKEPNFPI